MQWHRQGRQPESIGGRDDHHVAVPIGSERNAEHHFAPVGFDGVEVGDRDPEEPAAESVVDRRDERLLVLSLLRAGDDVRAVFEDGCHERGNVGREILQIGRVEDEDVTAGDVAGGAQAHRRSRAAAGG